ncbi:MAG: hypothetical protein JWM86_1899 [Thermoleophilia bacterium]|nr:hypothetical protein [Thermoleophilia bacterium]
MSAWGEPHDDATPLGSSWQSLAGNAHQLPPQHAHEPAATPPQQPEQPQQPIYGGWTQPWQDEQGQWHYPFAHQQPAQQPPYAPTHGHVEQPLPVQYVMPPAQPVAEPAAEPQPTFVEPEELAPVGPPRYAAPVRVAQDPRQRTLAAVIVFVCLLVAIWAILGFMGSLADTLSSISSGNEKLKLQLGTANQGLANLDTKTRSLAKMSSDSKELKGQLGTIDGTMGGMLKDVDTIAKGMEQMDTTLITLDEEIGKVNEINSSMSSQLGVIAAGLKSQVVSVRSMRKDVVATGDVLGSLGGRLAATNGRLGHINNSVNIMGVCGITNNLEVDIFLGPLRNGSAKVYATVIPPNAWGDRNGKVVPC